MIQLAGLLDIEVVPLEFEAKMTPASVEVISHTPGRFETIREGGEFKAVTQRNRSDMSSFSRTARIHSDNMRNAKSHKSLNSKEIPKFDLGHYSPSLANTVNNSNYSCSKSMKQLTFEYTPQTINFNWIREEKIMQITPGRVDFQITQYPEVLIDYLGGPIYCPPKSDPNYVEPLMNMVV